MPTKKTFASVPIDRAFAAKLITPLVTETVVHIEVPDPIPPCAHCGAPVDTAGKWTGEGDYESDLTGD